MCTKNHDSARSCPRSGTKIFLRVSWSCWASKGTIYDPNCGAIGCSRVESRTSAVCFSCDAIKCNERAWKRWSCTWNILDEKNTILSTTKVLEKGSLSARKPQARRWGRKKEQLFASTECEHERLITLQPRIFPFFLALAPACKLLTRYLCRQHVERGMKTTYGVPHVWFELRFHDWVSKSDLRRGNKRLALHIFALSLFCILVPHVMYDARNLPSSSHYTWEVSPVACAVIPIVRKQGVCTKWSLFKQDNGKVVSLTEPCRFSLVL